MNSINPPKLTPTEQVRKTGSDVKAAFEECESVARKKANEMIMAQFEQRLELLWDHLPKSWKRSLIQAVDFTDSDQVVWMARAKWHQYSDIQKNMITNGVVRIIRMGRAFNGALLETFS